MKIKSKHRKGWKECYHGCPRKDKVAYRKLKKRLPDEPSTHHYDIPQYVHLKHTKCDMLRKAQEGKQELANNRHTGSTKRRGRFLRGTLITVG